jgi:hypothetical protein
LHGAERAGFAAFFDFTTKYRNLYRIVRQAEFVDEGFSLLTVHSSSRIAG